MPRTHFFNTYTAVVALERFQKKNKCEDPSSVAEQSFLLLTGTDKKIDTMLEAVGGDISKLDPNTPLMTLGEFCKVLEKCREPLEKHARYSPGITEYVTHPDAPEGTDKSTLVTIDKDIDKVAEEAKALDLQRLKEGIENPDEVEARAKAAVNASKTAA